ncbi:MAG: redox-regulated ATPase YchF, partial [Dehalococcoidia bacterium]
SGKTTVFNALTRGHAPTSISSAASKPNIGVAKVADPRLDRLAEIFLPQRTVAAEVTYVDIPGAPEGLGRRQGIGGAFLNDLQRADAMLHVVRAFDDASVPHVSGSVDPFRDVSAMDMELTFSDMAIMERRLRRLEAELKGAKPAQRDAAQRERHLLERVQARLEEGAPVRAQAFTPDETALLAGYQFLTAKPLLVVLNIDEGQLPQASAVEDELTSRLEGPGVLGAALCGKLEAELGQMDGEDEQEFRDSLGAGEPGRERLARLAFEALGLVTFFTVVSNEVRAWAIAKGAPAVKAAGKVHSDMERGFVRAEVIGFDDLAECSGMAEAKKRGLLRLEGKAYGVQDGDVILFLFSV